jgi:hypothetical protein
MTRTPLTKIRVLTLSLLFHFLGDNEMEQRRGHHRVRLDQQAMQEGRWTSSFDVECSKKKEGVREIYI